MAKLTVDNLGVEASTRYAQDQEVYDKSLITDARVSTQTQIDVTAPSQVSEIDQLLNTVPTVTPWSTFTAPPNFYTQNRGLFTYQVCPSMGTEDKQEALVARLEANPAPSPEEEARKSKLLQLFQATSPLDKDLDRANSERNRYHKG